jgi:hypothetical protein
MDHIINDIENTRAPDKVIKERLFEDDRSEFEKQTDEALYLSLQELKEQEEINSIYEDDIINTYTIETRKRRELFRDLLFDLNKLTKFDKDIKEIYEIIEPIIDTYCGQFINFCELDEETYDNIFKIVGTVRTNKKNIEALKTILIKNH